ncbi:MAG: class I SAM-dependent methyltransferase, partial [Acidobacteriota bacterium]
MVLVDLLRPRVIVEVGGRDGVSYGAFCQAVMELQLESSCFSISYRQHEDENDPLEFESLNGFHNELYGGYSRRIQSSRSEALALFEDHTIDLLHIAPGTLYPDAKRSFESWLPKLSDRGVMLLSDTNFHADQGGLWKLWAENKDNYPHFEFVHERGLGVLSIGASPPDRIKQLLEAREPDVSLIREFFRQQGQRLKVRLEKDREINTLNRQAQDRGREMLELSAKLEGSQRHEGVL